MSYQLSQLQNPTQNNLRKTYWMENAIYSGKKKIRVKVWDKTNHQRQQPFTASLLIFILSFHAVC